jgi:DNA-binding phage protein
MVNWIAVENTPDGQRILDALKLALRGTPVSQIARETGIPRRSLDDIRKEGAFSHRRRSR